MGLLKNKRGVESLPLRYIIIALVAALVIGIALQFVGVLRGGTIDSANKINKTLAEKTTCELDEEAPTIISGTLSCNNTTSTTTVKAQITDDCGVKEAWIYIKDTDSGYNTSLELSMNGTDNKNANWVGDMTNNTLFNGTDHIEGYIYAKDKSPVENMVSYNNAYFVDDVCSS